MNGTQRQSIAELARAIDKITSRLEIGDLLVRYTRGCDRGDIELLKSVYHPDAVDLHGVFNGSAEEFAAWATARHLGFRHTTHYITNSLIEIDGDVANGETYCQVWLRSDEQQSVDRVMGGRYLDHFDRREGTWKIARRQLIIDWHTHIDATTLPDDATRNWTSGSRDRSDPSYDVLS